MGLIKDVLSVGSDVEISPRLIPEQRVYTVYHEGQTSPIRLLFPEKLHGVSDVDLLDPTKAVDPTDALLRVNQVMSTEHIGYRPALAAVSTEENRGIKELGLFGWPFGRDGIQMAKDELQEYPQMAHKAIHTYAQSQGVSYNYNREEAPGKIVHESRPENDPIAQEITKEKNWGWPYYGSIDATPAYISLVDAYITSQGSPDILDEEYIDGNGDSQNIRHAVELAINWMEERLNSSPLGLLEYKQEQPGGIENQVWRDSWEAFHHSDGTIADNTYGIASFSVQIEAYKALQAAARLFPDKGKQYLAKAARLKQLILNFWVRDEDGGYFALGAERDKDNNYKLLEVRTSDMGHILDSDILEGDDPLIVKKRNDLVHTLFSSEMLGTSGIRTLGEYEVRYNEGAYHNGSVWPRENNIIANGLARHGYKDLAYILHKKNVFIWETLGIFPEKVSGDNSPKPKLSKRIVEVKDPYRGIYKLEQPSQELQGWSITAIRNSMRYVAWYESQLAA